MKIKIFCNVKLSGYFLVFFSSFFNIQLLVSIISSIKLEFKLMLIQIKLFNQRTNQKYQQLMTYFNFSSKLSSLLNILSRNRSNSLFNESTLISISFFK
jgi:hypothetical protein